MLIIFLIFEIGIVVYFERRDLFLLSLISKKDLIYNYFPGVSNNL